MKYVLFNTKTDETIKYFETMKEAMVACEELAAKGYPVAITGLF